MVILNNMKTAISIPDNIFKNAEFLAHQLGITRSELYSKAIAEFVKERGKDIITEKLNEIYNYEKNSLDDKLSEMQFKSIKLDNNEW